MFAKLLKHEWRATRSIIGLLCVIVLIAGLTIGGVMNYMVRLSTGENIIVLSEAVPMSDVAEVLCVLLLVAAMIAIAVCCAGSVFFVIYRFYKSRFTDEGYLTFTLPVTHHQLLLSSIVNSILGIMAVLLAAFAAAAIVVALFLIALPQEIIWADVVVSVSQVWDSILNALEGHGGRIALSIGSGIATAFGELIVLMLAVTIGALIAKKHKIIAAVAVYYGIGMVQSFAYSIFTMTAATSEDVTMLLGAPGLMGILIAVGGYFLMHYLTSRKLNLA